MFNFRKLKEENLALVLSWRLKSNVSKFLFTEVENNIEKQKEWFRRVSQDPSYQYWIIYYQDTPIGLFNLCNFDPINKRTNAGYYIGEEKFHQLGGLIPPYFYNFLFKELNIHKIYGEVIEGNSILKIHLAQGYRLVGTMKDHLFKDDRFHDIHIVELLSADWLSLTKYSKYNCHFER